MVSFPTQRCDIILQDQPIFLLSGFWIFSQFAKLISARTIFLFFLFLFSFPSSFFFFSWNENWNPFRLPPPPPPSSPSLLSVAAWVWKSVNHKRLGYIQQGFPLQPANRTGVLTEAIATILEVLSAVLRDDLIQSG